MKPILLAALLTLLASPAFAANWTYGDSGIGSYSNAYGNGWTKTCCDYPYYYPSRLGRSHSRRRYR